MAGRQGWPCLFVASVLALFRVGQPAIDLGDMLDGIDDDVGEGTAGPLNIIFIKVRANPSDDSGLQK